MFFKRLAFAATSLLAFADQALSLEASALKFLEADMEGHDPKDHWAVIVAGSKSFWNYRHQADAAHARQILAKNGVPLDQIIYMAYDDVPYDETNPFPGQLFNKKDGENVYDGTKLDYKGEMVTADNFYAVLKGDSETTGRRTLQSNSKSKVFVYFTDHGAPGLVQMPAGGRPIFADELQEVIDYMEAHQMYDEMVFYIEACESGSMFPKLRDDQRVYAVTASNATQSSYAAYCAPDNTVNGVSLVTCLGDEFSVSWMEDTEAHDPDSETLSAQFETLKKKTARSPVQEFGSQAIKNDAIGQYQGTLAEGQQVAEASNEVRMWANAQPSAMVDSRDAKLAYFEQKTSQNDADQGDYAALEAEKKHRANTDMVFSEVFGHHDVDNLTVVPADFDCLRDLYNTYEHVCQPFEDYSLKYVKHLVHACETESFSQLLDAKKRMTGLCMQLGEQTEILQ